jgi:hypothetical protein
MAITPSAESGASSAVIRRLQALLGREEKLTVTELDGRPATLSEDSAPA